MVSILVVTIDRSELTRKCVSRALESTGCEYELLWTDNNSRETDVINFMQNLSPAYARLNQTNEGYAKSLNQLRLRAKGDYICVIDPDIWVPWGWLQSLVLANQAIGDSGISGFHCVLDLKTSAPVVAYGISYYPQEEVHGVKFFNARFGRVVGYWCEEFPPYGNEDVEFNRRSKMAGFLNYYLTEKSQHLGDDVGENTPYRKMKWDYLKVASEVLDKRFKYFEETGDYYVPPPEMA